MYNLLEVSIYTLWLYDPLYL